MDNISNSIIDKNYINSVCSFTLRGNRTKKFSLIILILLLIFSIIVPIIGTILLTINNNFQIGLIFSFVIFWGIGFYWLKLLLWNLYGKEILTLYIDKLCYTADYKLFKGEQKIISNDNLKINIQEYKDGMGTLHIENDSNVIETVLKTDLLILKDICNSINSIYSKSKE